MIKNHLHNLIHFICKLEHNFNGRGGKDVFFLKKRLPEEQSSGRDVFRKKCHLMEKLSGLFGMTLFRKALPDDTLPDNTLPDETLSDDTLLEDSSR